MNSKNKEKLLENLKDELHEALEHLSDEEYLKFYAHWFGYEKIADELNRSIDEWDNEDDIKYMIEYIRSLSDKENKEQCG